MVLFIVRNEKSCKDKPISSQYIYFGKREWRKYRTTTYVF